MGIEVAIAAIGVAVSAAGTIMGVSAANKQAKAQKESLRLQRQAEEERRTQMRLEEQRKKRQIIREQQIARAQAISTATNQGAGQSSGLFGGVATIDNVSRNSTLGVTQNADLGNRMFDINSKITDSSIAAANAGTMMYTAQGIGSLGGMLTRNAGTIARIGGFA